MKFSVQPSVQCTSGHFDSSSETFASRDLKQLLPSNVKQSRKKGNLKSVLNDIPNAILIVLEIQVK